MRNDRTSHREQRGLRRDKSSPLFFLPFSVLTPDRTPSRCWRPNPIQPIEGRQTKHTFAYVTVSSNSQRDSRSLAAAVRLEDRSVGQQTWTQARQNLICSNGEVRAKRLTSEQFFLCRMRFLGRVSYWCGGMLAKAHPASLERRQICRSQRRCYDFLLHHLWNSYE